ncbi:hypothetical protein Mgra_00002392 [Meloidogyne graminicola]|uniref:Mitochondrial carrier protein n=1 Tax=Meloidogyne graminicola TaxID=189291 RepID=A0A8S9ZYT0_9BILA|nr:hypothetical protein Mgra_00002392 [Meloidogyne graminicola]
MEGTENKVVHFLYFNFYLRNIDIGAIAGVFTTSVMVPGERIKCLLQVQHSGGEAPKYNGPIDVIKKLYKEGGIRSIYRGTGATLLRDIPASGAYISVYEYLKAKFSGEKGQLTPMTTLMAGGFAGIANWSVCIPADVMKSRLQTAPEGKYSDGIRGVFREIMREEGPRALFKGFAPVMLRMRNYATGFMFEMKPTTLSTPNQSEENVKGKSSPKKSEENIKGKSSPGNEDDVKTAVEDTYVYVPQSLP